MPKITDAFIFYNELDMLEFRLTELNDVVDYFIIVEALETFTGETKPLFFNENKGRFEKFMPKITHVVVQDMPDGDAWARETHQRNCITRGVDVLNPTDTDIIIISDSDEIPDTNMLAKYKRTGLQGARRPIQDIYYYNLNCKGRFGNSRCRIMNYQTYKVKSPEKHTKSGYLTVPRGGWHFSYFGSEDFIINKIQQFSHQEFNKPDYTDKEMIRARIRDCADLFARGVPGGPHQLYYVPIENNNYLPKNYRLLLKFQNQNTKDTSSKVIDPETITKNVIYYCIEKGKECFEDYIDSLGIITRKIYYSRDSELDQSLFVDPNNVHIFRYHLPQFLLDANNPQVYVLNTEQLSEPSRLAHIETLVRQGIKIIDYSLVNINILKSKISIASCFYIPYQYHEEEVKRLQQFSLDPQDDVGIVSCNTPHRKAVLQQLISAGIKAVDICGWKDARDRQIGSCRILLNVHFESNFKIFEHIRCDRWLFAGKIVISEPVNDSTMLDIKDMVIFTASIVDTVKEQLVTNQQRSPCAPIIEERRKHLNDFINNYESS